MAEEYITMHDDIKRHQWVIGGPLLELCILSLVAKPKGWGAKYIKDKEEFVKPIISKEQLLKNRYAFLKNIILKLKEMKSIMEIIESDDRIETEIELLNQNELINKDKSKVIDMKVLINIGYKREGRLMIKLCNEDIIHIKIMYVDEGYNFKNTKELRKLLNQMVKCFNGICGSIGHENDILSIINADRLLVDDNIYGFFDIKWNHKVRGNV
jgi:hypothetical protein